MQVPGRRAHAGAAPYARVRGRVRGKVRGRVRRNARDKVRGIGMRVVILCSSPYSETGCAVAARMAQLGYVPVGAMTLPSWDRRTLLRKVGQWGLRDSLHYAVSKLSPGKSTVRKHVRNPYLESSLRHGDGVFRSVREVAHAYGFPVVT